MSKGLRATIRAEEIEYRELIEKAFLIRSFEEKLLALFSEGKVNGTVHTCIGQEWTGVAVSNGLKEGDVIFSNHRGHGHFLSFIGDIDGLMAEIMGRSVGVCGGIGGSQHLYSAGFYSNGIQGGMVPISVGSAMSQKLSNSNNISVVFVGDGTLGQGILYESLNIASKWDLPLLIVIERNGFAQSTDTNETIAGTIQGRAGAFGIAYRKSNTWEWKRLISDAEEAIKFVRINKSPLLFEIDTFRLKAHSKGDDNRPKSLVDEYSSRDPLNIMVASASIGIQEIIRGARERVEQAAEKAIRSNVSEGPHEVKPRLVPLSWASMTYSSGKIFELINTALRHRLASDPKCLLIGEDIRGPNYGGAFKVTKNLSEDFPERVLNTPISEASIVGLGTGLAISGYHPVVEIMFGDFMTLTVDQIFQHACKFHTMYNGNVDVPLVLRTPMGGKRGYGPTHSQSIEKLFLGMPNLRMIALNQRISPAFLYDVVFKNLSCIHLIIENKILYTRDLKTERVPGYVIEFSNELFPSVRLRPAKGRPSVSIVCYGGTLEDAEVAVSSLFLEDEILCEVVCPTLISPIDVEPVLDSVSRTQRLLVLEEGSKIAAFGSEVVARLAEGSATMQRVKRIGYDSIIPSALEAEREVLVNPKMIVDAVKEIIQ